jgi:hypothetical protein
MFEEEYNERLAIIHVHGRVDLEDARVLADICTRWPDDDPEDHLTRTDAPTLWRRANSHWWGLTGAVLSEDEQKSAKAKLKERHGVESFNQLTVPQIEESIERIRRWSQQA